MTSIDELAHRACPIIKPWIDHPHVKTHPCYKCTDIIDPEDGGKATPLCLVESRNIVKAIMGDASIRKNEGFGTECEGQQSERLTSPTNPLSQGAKAIHIGELIGEAYQLAGQCVHEVKNSIHAPTEAQKIRLLDILAFDLPDALEVSLEACAAAAYTKMMDLQAQIGVDCGGWEWSNEREECKEHWRLAVKAALDLIGVEYAS